MITVERNIASTLRGTQEEYSRAVTDRHSQETKAWGRRQNNVPDQRFRVLPARFCQLHLLWWNTTLSQTTEIENFWLRQGKRA